MRVRVVRERECARARVCECVHGKKREKTKQRRRGHVLVCFCHQLHYLACGFVQRLDGHVHTLQHRPHVRWRLVHGFGSYKRAPTRLSQTQPSRKREEHETNKQTQGQGQEQPPRRQSWLRLGRTSSRANALQPVHGCELRGGKSPRLAHLVAPCNL